jgi:hypothetical protein
MLTYERSDSLEIVGHSDSDFEGCLDTDRSTSGYVFKLAGAATIKEGASRSTGTNVHRAHSAPHKP